MLLRSENIHQQTNTNIRVRSCHHIYQLYCMPLDHCITCDILSVCFVDFSKAFDLVNRHILFYKIIRDGWKGRVIDTLRELYAHSHFRAKRASKISPPISNQIGVNQGGVALGLLFRKYMQDISDYLSKVVDVCISNEIIVHRLWADDLILFSDTTEGLQKQLNGLYKYCSNNHTIVNETKTKVVCFGRSTEIRVNYNGVPLSINTVMIF